MLLWIIYLDATPDCFMMDADLNSNEGFHLKNRGIEQQTNSTLQVLDRIMLAFQNPTQQHYQSSIDV